MLEDDKAKAAIMSIISKHKLVGAEAPAIVALIQWLDKASVKPAPKPVENKEPVKTKKKAPAKK